MEQDHLRRIAEALERIADQLEARSTPVVSFSYEEPDDSKEAPAWLTSENIEPLAKELAAYARQNMPEADGRWLDGTVSSAFWEEKGLPNRYSLPSRASLLVERIEKRVSQLFEEEEKEALKREQELVPELVAQCAAWARERSIKRLNQADVAAILAEGGPPLNHQTVRSVWQAVNLDLKS